MKTLKHDGFTQSESAKSGDTNQKISVHDINARAVNLIHPTVATSEEWLNSRLAPQEIVSKYLYADIRVLVGSGQVGKTTLLLYEAIHIVLGRDLYGRKILTPGNVVIISAEDKREQLIARLRGITAQMGLGKLECECVRVGIFILDASGNAKRLTEIVKDCVVVAGSVIDAIIAACKLIAPVLVVFDPAVSFGVGESRINDAEQGLIMAARKLIAQLNCCITFIHHTGKANATNAGSKSANVEVYDLVQNQYVSRGGSALSDGARMVHVLGAPSNKEFMDRTGQPGPGVFLGLAKMSYCVPSEPIILKRNGFNFEVIYQHHFSAEQLQKQCERKIIEFLINKSQQGEKFSKKTLINTFYNYAEQSFTVRSISAAIDSLLINGQVLEQKLDKCKGQKKTFLAPANETKTIETL